MQDWSYAVLAKEASMNGGPNRFRDLIREEGIAEGRIQGGLIASAIILTFSVLGYAGFHKKNRAIAKAFATADPETEHASSVNDKESNSG